MHEVFAYGETFHEAESDHEWSLAVLERDDWRCQWPGCPTHGNEMVTPHHGVLRGMLSTKLVLENGITLCLSHHNAVQEEIPKRNGNYDRAMEILIGPKRWSLLKRMSGARPAKRRTTSVLQAIADISGKQSKQSREHLRTDTASRYLKLRRGPGSR